MSVSILLNDWLAFEFGLLRSQCTYASFKGPFVTHSVHQFKGDLFLCWSSRWPPVSRLRMSGTIPLRLYTCSWRGQGYVILFYFHLSPELKGLNKCIFWQTAAMNLFGCCFSENGEQVVDGVGNINTEPDLQICYAASSGTLLQTSAWRPIMQGFNLLQRRCQNPRSSNIFQHFTFTIITAVLQTAQSSSVHGSDNGLHQMHVYNLEA